MSKMKMKIEYMDGEVIKMEFENLFNVLHYLRRLKLSAKLAKMTEFFDRITITPESK